MGCKKYPDPGFEMLTNYSIQPLGNNQMASVGTILPDDIGVQVYDYENQRSAEGFLVRFKVLAGNGSLVNDSLYTNSQGIATTQWTLGTNYNFQKVLCETVNPAGKLINSQMIQATATGLKPWDTIQGYYESQLQTLVPDYVHHTTFLISRGILLTYSGSDYTWVECTSFSSFGNPRTIVTDNLGWVFVSTWNGKIYKTNDGGISFTQCTSPDPTDPYFVDLAITSTHILFAGTYGQKMYRSTNRGNTWQKVDDLSDYLTWVVACTDSIFFRTGMIKSTDQGVSWAPVGDFNDYWGAYSEKDGNLLFIKDSQINSWNLELCLSPDYLKSNTVLKTISSTYSPQKSFFYKVGSLLYYAQSFAGVHVSSNNKDFQLFWRCDNLTGFFVDHNNRFIATDNYGNMYDYNQP
jgi:hypothetical protein